MIKDILNVYACALIPIAPHGVGDSSAGWHFNPMKADTVSLHQLFHFFFSSDLLTSANL